MTDRELPWSHFTELHEADQDKYRALSGLAIAGLALGVLSVVALIDPRAAVVSGAGVLASGLALWRIARRGAELTGRKAAVAGLLLSLLFGSIALGYCLTYRWLLVRQSRQVAMAWFDLVAQGQPHVAHQLLFAPHDRQPPGGDLWEFYCSDQKRYKGLEQYLGEPVVRTLVALGKRATVRPYATEDVDTRARERLVIGLYSVTFDQDGRKTTFLVRLTARRLNDDAAGRATWQIIGLDGGVRPAWEEQDNWLTSS
jgi:hypothetical protein